jgi:hypothetical protein
MTAFETDGLLFEGEHWGLRSDPLGEWLRARGYRNVMRSTANWRGYVARWEIADGELRLTAVTGEAEVDGEAQAYDGLVGLPVDPVAGIGIRGLMWPAVANSDVVPRWCFDAADRVAVLVDGGPASVDPNTPLDVGGVVVDPNGATWRPAAPADAIWNVRMSAPDGVYPVDEGWYPVSSGSQAAGQAPTAPIASLVTAPAAFVRHPVDPDDGRRWYRAADLHVATRERRTLDIEALFAAPAPIVADWFTGSLSAVGGQLLQYVHAGFESRFEKTLFVTVEQGRVVGHRVLVEERAPEPPTPPPRPRRWWRRR